MVGSVYIPDFCVCGIFYAFCHLFVLFLGFVFIAVFVGLHVYLVTIQNSVKTSSQSLIYINLIYYIMILMIVSPILLHYLDF